MKKEEVEAEEKGESVGGYSGFFNVPFLGKFNGDF
jgi:hypothetical protein